MDLSKIGIVIKTERTKQGISVQELAELIQTTDRTIYYWENGQRKPSLEYADRVLKALGIQITIGGYADLEKSRMSAKKR